MKRLVILLALGVAAIGGGTVFALSQKSQVFAQVAPASPNPVVTTQPAASPVPSVAVANPTSQSLKISGCNGSPAHANFRKYPSFPPGSVLGVVAIGESVTLTGRTTQAEGERWHEAINLTSLHPTLNTGSPNPRSRDQRGWIANCFVNLTQSNKPL